MKASISNPSFSLNPTSKSPGTLTVQFRETLSHLWHELTELITRSPELKIWQTSDRKGNTCWRVYDPQNGYSYSFGSEADVRAWLEQHHDNQGFCSFDSMR